MYSHNSTLNDTMFHHNASTPHNDTPFDMSCHIAHHNDYGVMLSIRVFFGASLIFVVVGLVGNGLSMAVFSSKEMRAVSSNVYLLALAASDSLYLVLIFVTKLLSTMRCWYFPDTLIDVANHYTSACVLTQYLSDLFSDYSTCLILLFTIERSVAVFLPMRYKELCTVRRARLACGALLLILGVAIAPYHVALIELNHAYRFCGILENNEHLFVIIYVVELLLFRVSPVFVIAVLNAFIIVRITKLTRAKNKRRAASKLLLGSSGGGGGGGGGVGCGAPGCNGGGGAGSGGGSHRNAAAKNEDRNLQLTIILILVSTSYILLYIPVLIDFAMRSLMSQAAMDGAKESLMIAGNYTKTLYICGFAINFFLYTVSGRVFRDQLRGIVCGGGRTGERGETSVGVKTQATNAPEASSAV